MSKSENLLRNLGFPPVNVHDSFNHFDFSRESRRILVIGPMGSGKTEYSARVYRDSKVMLEKSSLVAEKTTTNGADRRKVFFVRSVLDKVRFPDYPEDALAYRGGFERCGGSIAHIQNSFDFEKLVEEHPETGTWIIDEASFYDERLMYIVKNLSETRGYVFIFPTLILNFRKDIFNSSARILLDTCTDVFPLSAYCEHQDCMEDSIYTYRYYTVDGKECPALYFDPLIIVGGDGEKRDPVEPDYCTRCEEHHYLPAKEYTFIHLIPMGAVASSSSEALMKELWHMKEDIEGSELYNSLKDDPVGLNSLLVPFIAERALIFLFAERNLISETLLKKIIKKLDLNSDYMERRLSDNNRFVDFSPELFD